MRSEEEIRVVRSLLMNDLLEQITIGGHTQKRTHATERLRTLQWVLGETNLSPAPDKVRQ
jgi:hypothetical protein